MSTERDRILGDIQALRIELSLLRYRQQAREIKGGLLKLAGEVQRPEAFSDNDPTGADIQRILNDFTAEAERAIVHRLGSSAWDSPESIREALARTSKPDPSLPATGLGTCDPSPPHAAAPSGPLTDEELDRIVSLLRGAANSSGPMTPESVLASHRLVQDVRRLRADTGDIRRAAQRLIGVCGRPDNEEDRKIRDEAVAVLSGRFHRQAMNEVCEIVRVGEGGAPRLPKGQWGDRASYSIRPRRPPRPGVWTRPGHGR